MKGPSIIGSRRFVVFCIVVCAVFLCALIVKPKLSHAQEEGAEILIINESDWEIYHLYLSPTRDDDWGPDQLGNSTIEPKGGRFKLHSIACNKYDIRVVDEDGDSCVMKNVPMCEDSNELTLTNKILLQCEGSAN